jgi:hypothetical protein
VSIRGFFKKSLKVFVVLGLVMLVGSLAAGAFFYYRHHTGPGKALQALLVALGTGDKAGLAVMVDFRALAEDLAEAVNAVYPQDAADETQYAEMRDAIQSQAFQTLAVKKGAKPASAVQHKPFAPVPPVPGDIIAQIAAGLKLETISDDPPAPEDLIGRIAARLKLGKAPDETQLWSHFIHHELHVDLPLRLRMERRQGAWTVTHLLNAQEVVTLYKEAADALRAEDIAGREGENEKTLARMRAHFHEPQCMAAVHLMSNKHEAMLVVKVTASNTDTTTLHHVNLTCDVRAGNGTQVYSRQLNVVQRVQSGGAFANTWTVVLDADSEDAVRLLRAGPLSCTVEPTVLSVGVGEILYQRKID